jgi:hypothetical protein
MILRNPIDRAVSNWNLSTNRGDVADSMSEVMRGWKSGKTGLFFDIVDRGFYYQQIKSLLKYYPREQMHIVIAERLWANTKKEMNQTFNFLGLPDCDIMAEKTHVAEYVVELSEEEREELRKIYQTDVSRLRQLLDDEMPEWTDFRSIRHTYL